MTITFEPADAAVTNRENLANAVRCAILYIFHSLRDGVERPHPDRHNDEWYKLFVEDVYRARRLRHLLVALDPSEKEDET